MARSNNEKGNSSPSFNTFADYVAATRDVTNRPDHDDEDPSSAAARDAMRAIEASLAARAGRS